MTIFEWIVISIGCVLIIQLSSLNTKIGGIQAELTTIKNEIQNLTIDVGVLRQRYAPLRIDYP